MSEKSAGSRAAQSVKDVVAGLPLVCARGFLRLVSDRRRSDFAKSLAIYRPLGYPGGSLAIRVASESEYTRSHNWRKEPETLEWLKAAIKPDDVFYDIGANVGNYSLIAHAVSGGKVRVCSFEPNPMTFASLCANLNHNRVNGTALGIALGRERGMLTLTGSLEEAGPTSRTDLEGGFAVLCERLDDLVRERGLPAPTVMKIDVDGAEEGVLLGAQECLRSPGLRSVLIELDQHDDQHQKCLDIMAAAGWEPVQRHVRGTGKRYCNVIFERPGYASCAASSASIASSSLGSSNT